MISTKLITLHSFFLCKSLYLGILLKILAKIVFLISSAFLSSSAYFSLLPRRLEIGVYAKKARISVYAIILSPTNLVASDAYMNNATFPTALMPPLSCMIDLKYSVTLLRAMYRVTYNYLHESSFINSQFALFASDEGRTSLNKK